MAVGRWEDDGTEGGDEPVPARPERQILQDTRTVYRDADRAYAPYSCAASGECCQLAVTGRQPWLWRNEWRLLEVELARTGRTLPEPRADGGCPLLDAAGKRCTVYAERPFGCRTFFCARIRGPAKQPVDEVVRLSRRLEALSLELDPELTGPRELLSWAADARRS